MVYEVTPSGWFDWFDNRTFEICFFYFEIWFVPAVAGKGKVALIGDNLGAHFSKAVMINVWKIIYFSYVCHQMQHIFASH